MSGTHSRAVTEERKLEGSPSDGPGTNCTFDGIAETIAKHMFRADFQCTRAICGLILPCWNISCYKVI